MAPSRPPGLPLDAATLQEPASPSLTHFIIAGFLVTLYLLSVSLGFEAYYFFISIGLLALAASLLNLEWGLLLVPAALMNPVGLTSTGTRLVSSEIVLLAIFSIFVLRSSVMRGRLYFDRKYLGLGGIIIVISAFSLFKAAYPAPGVLQIIRYIEIFLVLFVVVTNVCRTASSIRRMTTAIIAGGLIAAGIGIFQFISDSFAKGETGRVYGFLGGGYGGALVSTLFFCIGVLLHEKGPGRKLLAGATFLAALLALLLSQTRTWIGSFLVVLIVVLFFRSKRLAKRSLKLILAASAVIVVALATDMFGLVSHDALVAASYGAFRFGVRPGEYSYEDISLFLRANVWLYAVGLFLANPILGIGVANLRFIDYFPPALGQPGPDLGYVDNQYIQFFAEAGIIAGVAWLLYMAGLIARGFRTLKRCEGGALEAAAFGLYASVLAFALAGFFWTVTPSHELFSFMILLGALIVALDRVGTLPEFHG